MINIDGEYLHLFWTASGILMKFSGNVRLIIILKVTKFHTNLWLYCNNKHNNYNGSCYSCSNCPWIVGRSLLEITNLTVLEIEQFRIFLNFHNLQTLRLEQFMIVTYNLLMLIWVWGRDGLFLPPPPTFC